MTDLAGITEHDIRQALTFDEPASDEVDLEHLGANVLRELDRRLGDEDLAKDIPGTVLVQLAKDFLKIKAEQLRVEQAREDSQVISIREVIETAGLPWQRKWELVQAELERNKAEREDLHELVNMLRKEQG